VTANLKILENLEKLWNVAKFTKKVTEIQADVGAIHRPIHDGSESQIPVFLHKSQVTSGCLQLWKTLGIWNILISDAIFCDAVWNTQQADMSVCAATVISMLTASNGLLDVGGHFDC